MAITPIFCCGFECGLIITGAAIPASHTRHWDAVTGGGFISLSTTTVRNGSRSCRHNPTTSSSYLQKDLAAPTEAVVRFAIYFASLPSVDTRLAAFIPAAGAFCSLRYEVTGTQLVGAFGATGVATTPYPVTTGRWYVVDLLAQVGSGTRSVSVQVMDDTTKLVTDLGSQTTAVAASTISSFRFGSSVSSEIPSVDCFYDDVMLSASLADYPMGDGRVLAVSPGMDGTHSVTSGNFKINNTTTITGAETDLWTHVNDDDMTVAGDYLNPAVVAAGEYLELRPPANIGVPDTARCLTVITRMENVALTTTNSITFQMVSGVNTDNVVNAASLASINPIYFSKSSATLPGGALITESGIEELLFRLGFCSDVDPIPAMPSFKLELEYPPAEVEVIPYQIPGGRVTLTQRII